MADEIIDFVQSEDSAYCESGPPAFMFNDSVLVDVRKLKDDYGNYLWSLGSYTQGVPQKIIGYPVAVNQAIESIATGKKTILFGDMKKYYLRKVGAPALYVAR